MAFNMWTLGSKCLHPWLNPPETATTQSWRGQSIPTNTQSTCKHCSSHRKNPHPVNHPIPPMHQRCFIARTMKLKATNHTPHLCKAATYTKVASFPEKVWSANLTLKLIVGFLILFVLLMENLSPQRQQKHSERLVLSEGVWEGPQQTGLYTSTERKSDLWNAAHIGSPDIQHTHRAKNKIKRSLSAGFQQFQHQQDAKSKLQGNSGITPGKVSDGSGSCPQAF